MLSVWFYIKKKKKLYTFMPQMIIFLLLFLNVSINQPDFNQWDRVIECN